MRSAAAVLPRRHPAAASENAESSSSTKAVDGTLALARGRRARLSLPGRATAHSGLVTALTPASTLRASLVARMDADDACSRGARRTDRGPLRPRLAASESRPPLPAPHAARRVAGVRAVVERHRLAQRCVTTYIAFLSLPLISSRRSRRDAFPHRAGGLAQALRPCLLFLGAGHEVGRRARRLLAGAIPAARLSRNRDLRARPLDPACQGLPCDQFLAAWILRACGATGDRTGATPGARRPREATSSGGRSTPAAGQDDPRGGRRRPRGAPTITAGPSSSQSGCGRVARSGRR